MILSCENLSKSFGGTRALAGVSVDFPASGVVALIGPNGAGKTTLFNALTGFIKIDSGRVSLDKRNITGLAPQKISRLGMTRTFQDLRLLSQVSVLENIMLARPDQKGERFFFALLRFGVAAQEASNRRRALELLEFVGLAEKAGALAGALSFGQQKLLALACCLATEARILLLDEPFAGVHPSLILKILDLLGQISRSGKLIIFIEHDIAAVRQVADNVFVMDQGKIIADGTPREVLERPAIMRAYVG